MELSIGIDWGDRSHAICLRELNTRRVLAEFAIEHSAAGIARLEDTIAALDSDAGDCVVAIETGQGMLVNYLLDAGYRIHPIPPAAVKAYRNRRRRTGAKSDLDDARLLADIVCQDRGLFPPLVSDSPLAREIRATYRGREQLVRRRTQIINQLKHNLKTYFPVAIKLFSSLDAHIARAFLAAFPTQEAAQNATEDELRAFFRQQGYTRTDRIPDIISKLRGAFIPVPPWQTEVGIRLTSAFHAELAVLCEHIRAIEDRLGQLLAQHTDTPIFRSLPHVGPVRAAGFIGELGDCRSKFEDVGSLRALAGTAPVTIESGPTRRVAFRFACNKPLRYLLQQFARASARPGGSSWARGYLSNQLERGHSNSRAYRALANRWLAIIFRMWRDHSLYDENYHLGNIARRGAKPTSVALRLVEAA